MAADVLRAKLGWGDGMRGRGWVSCRRDMMVVVVMVVVRVEACGGANLEKRQYIFMASWQTG